jgi:hypothetical protein
MLYVQQFIFFGAINAGKLNLHNELGKILILIFGITEIFFSFEIFQWQNIDADGIQACLP